MLCLLLRVMREQSSRDLAKVSGCHSLPFYCIFFSAPISVHDHDHPPLYISVLRMCRTQTEKAVQDAAERKRRAAEARRQAEEEEARALAAELAVTIQRRRAELEAGAFIDQIYLYHIYIYIYTGRPAVYVLVVWPSFLCWYVGCVGSGSGGDDVGGQGAGGDRPGREGLGRTEATVSSRLWTSPRLLCHS